jgi:ZIP family zinc transporter
MPAFVQAGLWGLFAASGLTIGALLAVTFHSRLSHRLIAAVMGFGGGVLIAVVSVELMTVAYTRGDPLAAVGGLLAGGAVFSFINWRLAQHGAQNRKRCGECVAQPSEIDRKGSGLAIAAGAVLDGIPEALVIGMSMLSGGKIAIGVVAGFFLANVPQGLSSASGMQLAGRSRRYIFSVWIGITVVIGVAASVGALVLGSASPQTPAAILAFAAGAVLAMLAEAMIPEAFESAQPFIGMITVVGFLAAFLLIQHHV